MSSDDIWLDDLLGRSIDQFLDQPDSSDNDFHSFEPNSGDHGMKGRTNLLPESANSSAATEFVQHEGIIGFDAIASSSSSASGGLAAALRNLKSPRSDAQCSNRGPHDIAGVLETYGDEELGAAIKRRLQTPIAREVSVHYQEGENPLEDLIQLDGGLGDNVIVQKIRANSKLLNAGVCEGFALVRMNGRTEFSQLPPWQVKMLLRTTPVTLTFDPNPDSFSKQELRHASQAKSTEIWLRNPRMASGLGMAPSVELYDPRQGFVADEVVFVRRPRGMSESASSSQLPFTKNSHSKRMTKQMSTPLPSLLSPAASAPLEVASYLRSQAAYEAAREVAQAISPTASSSGSRSKSSGLASSNSPNARASAFAKQCQPTQAVLSLTAGHQVRIAEVEVEVDAVPEGAPRRRRGKSAIDMCTENLSFPFNFLMCGGGSVDDWFTEDDDRDLYEDGMNIGYLTSRERYPSVYERPSKAAGYGPSVVIESAEAIEPATARVQLAPAHLQRNLQVSPEQPQLQHTFVAQQHQQQTWLQQSPPKELQEHRSSQPEQQLQQLLGRPMPKAWSRKELLLSQASISFARTSARHDGAIAEEIVDKVVPIETSVSLSVDSGVSAISPSAIQAACLPEPAALVNPKGALIATNAARVAPNDMAINFQHHGPYFHRSVSRVDGPFNSSSNEEVVKKEECHGRRKIEDPSCECIAAGRAARSQGCPVRVLCSI